MSQRQHRKQYFIVLGPLVVAMLAMALWGYERVNRFAELALTGRVSAAAAVRSLEDGDSRAAVSLLGAAQRQFSDAGELLGPDWLHGIPELGRQVQAADDLCTVGVQASTAGLEMAQLLEESTDDSGAGRLDRLLGQAPARLEPALASMVALADVRGRMKRDGLVPPLAAAMDSLGGVLADVQPVLDRSRTYLNLERYFFSRQHRFLVVTQDSAELRPSGGSIETFALVDFGPNGFHMTTSADITSLAGSAHRGGPRRGTIDTGRLSLGEANWWMDFPTSAAQLLTLWRELGQPEVDGVVAVDIPMIQRLLGVYGAVQVPQVKAPLTARNLIEKLTQVAERDGTDEASTQRKKAVIAVTDQLVVRAADLTSDQVLPTLDAFARGANEKHLQMYLLDPAAQADLVTAGWAGALALPEGTTDLLAVSNASVAPGRANLKVTKSVAYDVRLAADGSAATTVTLDYRKGRLKLAGIPEPRLDNYVRVHRLPGTTLVPTPGSGFRAVPDQTGLATFGRHFRLLVGADREVLGSSVGQALVELPGVDGNDTTWRYRLRVAKQADLRDARAAITVSAPPRWRVAGAEARFAVTAEKLPTTVTGTSVGVTSPLTQDLVLEVVLRR